MWFRLNWLHKTRIKYNWSPPSIVERIVSRCIRDMWHNLFTRNAESWGSLGMSRNKESSQWDVILARNFKKNRFKSREMHFSLFEDADNCTHAEQTTLRWLNKTFYHGIRFIELYLPTRPCSLVLGGVILRTRKNCLYMFMHNWSAPSLLKGAAYVLFDIRCLWNVDSWDCRTIRNFQKDKQLVMSACKSGIWCLLYVFATLVHEW